jgi:DNA-binding response OmpR family regulator
VLLVGGDAVLRRALRLRLHAEGVNAHEASTGADATALMARASFGLVVVEEQLPDGSGLGWVTDLRGRGGRVPVALVAGLCTDVRSLAPAALGLDLRFVVEKHDVLRALPTRVRAFLARSTAPATVAPPPADPTERPPGWGPFDR